MKKLIGRWSGFLAVILLLASCAPTAHVEKDDSADFSRYKTFAWVDKDGEGKKDRNKSNDLTEQKIREAVSRELEKNSGWRESKRNPDILLSYDLLVERTVNQRSDAVYSQPFTRSFYNPYSRRIFNVYYPSQFAGYDNYNVPGREGTITITMTDTRTDKAVWQGWSTDDIRSRNMSSKEINGTVKSIFRKFDVVKN